MAKNRNAVPEKGSKFNLFMIVLIIVAMIGSTLAFGILSSNKQQQNTVENLPPLIDSQNQTSFKYSAKNVKGSVVELEPYIRIAFTAKFSNIDEADSNILEIEGVRNVSSRFVSSDPSKPLEKLLYLAEISMDSSADASQVVDLVKKKFSIGQVESLRTALVELPKTVNFLNEDLNSFDDYNFSDNLREAFVGIQTLKGDEIEVELTATLKGNDLQDLIVFETQNLSSQLQQHSVKSSLKIDSLKSNIAFSGDYNVSNSIDSNALRDEISKLPDFNSIDLKTSNPSMELIVEINSINAKAFEKDINSAISGLSGINSVSLVPDSNGLKVFAGFDENARISELKQKILESLKKTGFDEIEISITEPIVSINAGISLLSTNAKPFSDSLQNILSKKGVSEIKIFQQADSNAEFLEELGKKFFLPEKNLTVYVKPEHVLGDTLNVEISFYSQRDKVLFASAVEVENS